MYCNPIVCSRAFLRSYVKNDLDLLMKIKVEAEEYDNGNIFKNNQISNPLDFSSLNVFFIGVKYSFLDTRMSSKTASSTKNCSPIPENTEIVNGDLSDRRTFFIEDIMEDLEEDDYDKMYSLLGEILQQDMVEIIRSAFCNYCEECEYKTKYHPFIV